MDKKNYPHRKIDSVSHEIQGWTMPQLTIGKETYVHFMIYNRLSR